MKQQWRLERRIRDHVPGTVQPFLATGATSTRERLPLECPGGAFSRAQRASPFRPATGPVLQKARLLHPPLELQYGVLSGMVHISKTPRCPGIAQKLLREDGLPAFWEVRTTLKRSPNKCCMHSCTGEVEHKVRNLGGYDNLT